jgi:hypothetical protein
MRITNVKRTLLLGAAGLITAAGIITAPLASAADPAPGVPTGDAEASAVQVSLAPSALLSALPAVNGVLHRALSQAGTGADLVVRLAGATASGRLLSPIADLQQGHAESTALDLDLSPLGDQLSALRGALDGALSTLRGLPLPSASTLGTGVTGQGGGLLNGVLGTATSLGTGPVPQLGNLTSGLSQLQTLLGGITGDATPASVLHGLDPKLAETVSARYHVPGLPDTPVADASLADINLPTGAPLQLKLAPFHARAVNTTLANVNHIDAAQSSADNQIDSIDLTPKLELPAIGNLSGLPGLVTGLLGQPAGLPAGLLPSLSALSPLLGPDSLVGAILGGGLGLNSLVRATDVASSATVQPAGAGAEQSLASTRVGDLQVLPLGAPLLQGITGKLPADAASALTQRLGSLADLPLLDIKGVNSNAQAALGGGTTSPHGSAGFAEIDVLGLPVASTVDALAIAPGTEKTVPVPGTGLALQISLGVPAIGFDTPLHRAVSVTGLDVRLVGDGTGPLGELLGGSTGAASAGKPIVAVSLASSAAQIATAPVGGVAAAATPVVLTAAQGPVSPSTGLFAGPLPLGVAAGLGFLAVLLRLVPRLAARRITP